MDEQEWLSFAFGGKKDGRPGQVSGAFSAAVEEAISGVFLLSGKMAAFYGLYTWFTHSLFQLNIVFVPSSKPCPAVPLDSGDDDGDG